MKSTNILAAILLALSACEQTPKTYKATNQSNLASKDTITIYKNISSEVCSCTLSTMRNNKPSTSLDSCYKFVLNKYTDNLKSLGFDPVTRVGESKLFNEVISKFYLNCRSLSQLLQKEREEGNAKKLLFKGSIISQKQLPSGELEIIMQDNNTKIEKIFKSKYRLDDPTSRNKNILSYELTVEYEIIHNSSTDNDEFHIKENAVVIGTDVQKVEDK